MDKSHKDPDVIDLSVPRRALYPRDYEFRIRMIEHRDDEICRRWDALADEDHGSPIDRTRIFPLQEQMVASFKWARF